MVFLPILAECETERFLPSNTRFLCFEKEAQIFLSMTLAVLHLLQYRSRDLSFRGSLLWVGWVSLFEQRELCEVDWDQLYRQHFKSLGLIMKLFIRKLEIWKPENIYQFYKRELCWQITDYYKLHMLNICHYMFLLYDKFLIMYMIWKYLWKKSVKWISVNVTCNC